MAIRRFFEAWPPLTLLALAWIATMVIVAFGADLLAPYSFTVTAAPGDYTLVVHDTDESDGEGIGTSQDTKDITVQ